jgi:ribosome hibernation promoting factor
LPNLKAHIFYFSFPAAAVIIGESKEGAGRSIMEVELRIHNLDFADVLRDYVGRRLRYALSRFQTRVGRITFRISDENGPRGGRDKTCRVTAEVLPSGTIVLESTHANLFAAIDTVTERLRSSISRELDQRRDARLSRESVRREASVRGLQILRGGKA